MNLGKQLTSVSNAASKQINPVNLKHWLLYPFLIGLFLSILIILVWSPKFNGTYKYYDCPQSNLKNDTNTKVVVDYKKDCVEKEASVAKKNLVIILLILLFIPSIVAGIGFNIGFAVSNPKMYTGIYATNLFKNAIKS